jgi:hypothetical protein
VKAIKIVQHRRIERRRDGPFFFVAADVDVMMIGASVRQPVNQPGVGVERKDDRPVFGEELIEALVAQSVRMLFLRLQPHEIHDVDHPDFHVGKLLAHD